MAPVFLNPFSIELPYNKEEGCDTTASSAASSLLCTTTLYGLLISSIYMFLLRICRINHHYAYACTKIISLSLVLTLAVVAGFKESTIISNMKSSDNPLYYKYGCTTSGINMLFLYGGYLVWDLLKSWKDTSFYQQTARIHHACTLFIVSLLLLSRSYPLISMPMFLVVQLGPILDTIYNLNPDLIKDTISDFQFIQFLITSVPWGSNRVFDIVFISNYIKIAYDFYLAYKAFDYGWELSAGCIFCLFHIYLCYKRTLSYMRPKIKPI